MKYLKRVSTEVWDNNHSINAQTNIRFYLITSPLIASIGYSFEEVGLLVHQELFVVMDLFGADELKY